MTVIDCEIPIVKTNKKWLEHPLISDQLLGPPSLLWRWSSSWGIGKGLRLGTQWTTDLVTLEKSPGNILATDGANPNHQPRSVVILPQYEDGEGQRGCRTTSRVSTMARFFTELFVNHGQPPIIQPGNGNSSLMELFQARNVLWGILQPRLSTRGYPPVI